MSKSLARLAGRRRWTWPLHLTLIAASALAILGGSCGDAQSQVARERAMGLMSDGNRAAGEGRLSDAIRLQSDAIDLDPNHHCYYAFRAYRHVELGQLEAAIRDLEAARRILVSDTTDCPDPSSCDVSLSGVEAEIGSIQAALKRGSAVEAPVDRRSQLGAEHLMREAELKSAIDKSRQRAAVK